MDKKNRLTLGVLIAVALLTSSQIGNSFGGGASDAYVRVAVLNSSVSPPYNVGGNSNYFQQAMDVLNKDPYIIATNISNANIQSGALNNYDVLLLPDNWPDLLSDPMIINFWNKTNGGGIVGLDSAIAFFCYAGILPAESNGSNGRLVYWDYLTKNTAQITVAHPITAGYTVGQNITGQAGNARYNVTKMSTTAGYPYFIMLANEYANKGFSYVSAYSPPKQGRVVHIWENRPTNLPTRFLLLNAVRWAANAPSTTELLGIDALQDQINTLQNQISTLQSQLTAVGTQVTALQSQLTTLQTQLTNLQNQLTAMQSTLTTNITSLQNQITNLQTELNAVNQTYTNKTDSLNSNLNTTMMMSYAGIGVGAVGVIIAVLAIALSRRKPTK